MMATSYKILGIPMQRRNARRRLVVVAYTLLLLLCGSTFVVHLIYGENALLPYSLAIYGSMAVGIFVFGGTGGFGGRWGLIKPFANKPPRPEPPMVTLVKLQLQPESLLQADDLGWRNDERELDRRDRAHYQAYQAVGVGVVVMLALAFWALEPRQHLVPAKVLQDMLFLVALITTVLVMTLPAAIILWTEPDIDLG
jgi:hypothetical protein